MEPFVVEAPPCATTEPARTWTDTPTTSSPPTWPPGHRTRPGQRHVSALHLTRSSRGPHRPRTLDFRTLTQADFDAIADQLNGRPRQTLGFKTPSQALAE